MEDCERPVRCALLVGSMSQGQKRAVLEQIRSHQVEVVLGTHALFQEHVEFDDLGLVVVDEQHRFGVEQRRSLMDKGGVPHALFMSATPIPRSLAGVLYADMDVSILAEKPQNRMHIKSCVVGTSFRPNAYSLIRRELDRGHQAYIICSLVEESELMAGENVVDYSEKMKDLFGNTAVGMLHGRMSSQEKQDAMEAFASGETKVLVATTVVEVGVDVPNATVMLIEDAQRFGLAQLHQLRGRVGRGADQSYCIFMDTDDHPEDNERLKVMNASDDGFFIASEDLRLRGPGDLFGVRQSGELSFRLADIYRDGKTMQSAAEEAAASWRANCEN
jgi:ATP-dependent DNA helicase RecG